MTTSAPAPSDSPAARERFCELLQEALANRSLVRITLGAPLGKDRTLRNILVRPVVLKQGPRLSFVWRYATQDITKNFDYEEGLRRVLAALGTEFRTANLTTTEHIAQLEFRATRAPRLTLGKARPRPPISLSHDRAKRHPIATQDAAWLQDLGVTTRDRHVVRGMEDKFRQIQKFVELLQHLIADTKLLTQKPAAEPNSSGLTLVDMGCGKGYLTFAAYQWLQRASAAPVQILGIEARADLVALANKVAAQHGLAGLRFAVGRIAELPAPQSRADIVIALHACDTATDDAIAHGIRAGASLILVAPCCHKELRPQLQFPHPLRGALQHGILLEREAEFVTDALRAALLEQAGYDTRVFEFISPEHTSKNLMIAALRRPVTEAANELAQRARDLAAFYGVKHQRLAEHLQFPLTPEVK